MEWRARRRVAGGVLAFGLVLVAVVLADVVSHSAKSSPAVEPVERIPDALADLTTRLAGGPKSIRHGRALAREGWGLRHKGPDGRPPRVDRTAIQAEAARMPGGPDGPELPPELARILGRSRMAPQRETGPIRVARTGGSGSGGAHSGWLPAPLSLVLKPPTLNPWQSAGPDNFGGRTRALLVQPTRIFAGGVGGGIWRTTNGGNSWTPVADNLSNIAITAIDASTSAPDRIYAGTGESFNASDGLRGAGVYKSEDGGDSWALTPGTAATNSNFFFVNDLVVSSGTQNLYVATSTGLFESRDRGLTYTQRISSEITDILVVDVGFQDEVYVWRRGAGIARCLDGSGSYTFGGNGIFSGERASLAVGSTGDVWAAIASSGGAFSALFRTSDKGANWERRELTGPGAQPDYNRALFSAGCSIDPGVGSPVGDYANVLRISPATNARVWIGGVELSRSNDTGVRFGPASFSWRPFTQPEYLHDSQHAIEFSPGYNGTSNQDMFVANDGGVWISSNAEADVPNIITNPNANCLSGSPLSAVTYTSLNNGYRTVQFYGGGIAPTGDVIVAGAQDHGMMRRDPLAGPNIWANARRGNGYYAQINPNAPNQVYATGLLSETLTLEVFFRSTDGGTSFTESNSGISELASAPQNFVPPVPFAMDPSNPLRLWVGGRAPFRSTDGGLTWTRAVATATLTLAPISAWAIAPSGGGQVVYLGTLGGVLMRSDNALDPVPTWSVCGPLLTGIPIGAISVHPTDPFRVTVGLAAYDIFPGPIRFSPDSRQFFPGSFSDRSGTAPAKIPRIPVHSILHHPLEPQVMFVATESGVYGTVDEGLTWNNVNSGDLANTQVAQLQLQRDLPGAQTRVFAFTHGRGVSAARLKFPLLTVVRPDGGDRLVPGNPTPVGWGVTVSADEFPSLAGFRVDFSVVSGDGFPEVISPFVPTGTSTITWTVPIGLRSVDGLVRVQALDSGGSPIAEDTSDTTVTVNRQPVAVVSGTQVVLPGASVSITGTASFDDDGDPIAYSWAQITGPPSTLSSSTVPTPSFTAPMVRGNPPVSFDLTVDDNYETHTATTIVRVNSFPAANAGQDRRVTPGSTVTLAGSSTTDLDGQTLAYSWTALSGTPGYPQSTTNATHVAPLVRGTIQDFQLDVSDGLESASDTVRVTVNRLPLPVVSGSQRVPASGSVMLSAGGSTDPDFDPLTFSWAQLSGPLASFDFAAANPTFPAPATEGAQQVFRVTISDGVEPITVDTTVSVNRKPVAAIAAPAAVGISSTVVLDGSVSSDGDGDPLSYFWTQVAGPVVNFDPVAAKPTFTAPPIAGVNLSFSLQVFDGLESSTRFHTLRVNTPPEGSAGGDKSVLPSAAVTLSGSGSDADGDTLTYLWQQIAGSAVTLGNTQTAAVSFTAPATRGQSLALSLTTSDGVQQATSDVTVRVNRLPVALASAAAIVAPGATVALTGSGSSDADADPLTYAWTQEAGAAVSFAASTANPTFTAPGVRGSALAFSLKVSDAVESATKAVQVSINRLPEPKAPPVVSVAPGGLATLDAAASQDGDADALTYAWTQVEGPAVSIDAAAAVPSFSVGSFPRGTEFAFSLALSDGRETANAAVRVRVNREPVARVPGSVFATPGEPVRVDGATSTDGDQDPLTYRWRQLSGPAVAFEGTKPALAFTAPAVGRQKLSFELAVTDGVETVTSPVTVALSDRSYDADLGGGAGGGCRARPGGPGGVTSDGLMPWLLLLVFSWRRSRRYLPSLD